uniref:Uncharacterized protein n=1 Tax=Sphaerodactylus townsendi TaxID=933632 RepID=A0ACB8F409_9SAUR
MLLQSPQLLEDVKPPKAAIHRPLQGTPKRDTPSGQKEIEAADLAALVKATPPAPLSPMTACVVAAVISFLMMPLSIQKLRRHLRFPGIYGPLHNAPSLVIGWSPRFQSPELDRRPLLDDPVKDLQFLFKRQPPTVPAPESPETHPRQLKANNCIPLKFLHLRSPERRT